MSGSEEGSWRAIIRHHAARVQRDRQEWQINGGFGQRLNQGERFSRQRHEGHDVDVEDALLMFVRDLFIKRRRSRALMIMPGTVRVAETMVEIDRHNMGVC